MALLDIVLWSTIGFLVGAALVIFGAGNSATLRDMLLKNIFRSNKAGWCLVQRGNSYEFEPLTRDEDADAYRIGPEDEAEWVEDEAGLMHSIYRVPFGLKLESKRPIVDVETAAAAEGVEGKVTDGGLLDGTERFSLDDLQERLHVGTRHAGERTFIYVNPFVERMTDIVDLRNIGRVMRHDANPDTPRKTAKNAKEAERAFDGLGGLKEKGMYLASFMAGAVAAYIGGSGGGGGGGGVSVPVMITDLAVGVM